MARIRCVPEQYETSDVRILRTSNILVHNIAQNTFTIHGSACFRKSKLETVTEHDVCLDELVMWGEVHMCNKHRCLRETKQTKKYNRLTVR